MTPPHSGATRRRRTRLLRRVAILLATTLTVGALVTASRASAQTADEVAAQIVAVQATADRLAQRWAELEAQAQDLAEQLTAAAQRADQANAELRAVEDDMARSAIARYTNGTLTPAVLPVSDDVMDHIEMDALATFAMDAGVADADEYAALQRAAETRRSELAALQQSNDDNLAELAATRRQLDEQLDGLRAYETELRDEEVRRAYEAQRAEQLAELAAATAVTTSSTPDTQPARGDAAPPPATTTPPKQIDEPTEPSTKTNAPRPATTDAPTKEPATTAPRTTAPPKATTPTTPPPTDPPRATGLVCPIAGPNAFTNTWGDSRSGGRSHEGVDMMSTLGTPVVAVTGGTATMKTNTLGGITVGLNGDDGNYYYFAHLNAWEGSNRRVQRGEVIGYVGHTGNTTADHLHFGIYPNGGGAINPYPTVRPIC